MTIYADIEKRQTRNRLNEIKAAIDNFPSTTDYILGDVTLIDLMQMAEVADRDILLDFIKKPRGWNDN